MLLKKNINLENIYYNNNLSLIKLLNMLTKQFTRKLFSQRYVLKETFEENIGLLIHDVARLLRVLYDRQMASIGLTRSQWWLLTYLYFKDGINQSELANLMDIEKAPLSRLLDRMELKGWVERKIENKDRRIKNIYLSKKIKPLISSMRDKAADYRKDSLSILGNDDLDKLRELLQILKKDLTSKI